MIFMQKLYYTVGHRAITAGSIENLTIPPIEIEMKCVLFLGVLAGALAWAQTKPAAADPNAQPAGQKQEQPQPQPQPQQDQQASEQSAAPEPPAPVQQPSNQQPDAKALQTAMAASLAKQRVAAMQQVAAVMGKAPTPAASFFTVPWVETPVPFSVPPCDPMPTADLDKLVLENSQQQGVKPELIRGVIAQESGARPCAVSWKGAQGLMQLMPATSEQFGVKDPFDPHQNVEAGTKLLKQLLTKYNNDVSLALAAYNAGEARVDKDGGVPQIAETQNYVTDIQSKLPKK
jgi:soluble lytic murein transglycosylase-like protein